MSVAASMNLTTIPNTKLVLDRTQRLKDARSEAAKDVEAYKAQKEKELKEYESKVYLVSYHSL